MANSLLPLAVSAFGRHFNEFYAVCLLNDTKRSTPSIIVHWNGSKWRFIDRFAARLANHVAMASSGTFVVPHPNGKTLLCISPDGILTGGMQLDSSIEDVDLLYDTEGRLLAFQKCLYDEYDSYLAARINDREIAHFRFRNMQHLAAWALDPSGNLWGFGYTMQDSPLLVEAGSGESVLLPLPSDRGLLWRRLLLTRDDRMVIAIPFGTIYLGDFNRVRQDPAKLEMIAEMQPYRAGASPDQLIVTSIAEGEDGVVYLGNDQGLWQLRGGNVRGCSIESSAGRVPAVSPNGLLSVSGGVIVCGSTGVELIRGASVERLPGIDPRWFELPSQKIPKSHKVLLKRGTDLHGHSGLADEINPVA